MARFTLPRDLYHGKGALEELKHFEAQHNSPYGQIISKWEWNRKKITYEVVVPANSTATLYLPDYVKGDKVIKLEAGKHSLVLNVSK